MSSLILLVLLVGAVLYLTGALVYLYRYTQARRRHPQTPRGWEALKHRFFWLTGIGVVLLAGFVFFAWWSLPGNYLPWLPNPFLHQPTAAQQAGAPGKVALPAPKSVVSGKVPLETTTETTSTTTTLDTTTSSTTTETTTTAPPPPPRKTPPPRRAQATRARGAWTVCAASFRKKAMAEKFAARLAKQGLPATVGRVDLGKRGVWHRVCVGEFASLPEARGQYQQWERQGLISDAFLLPLR